MPQSELGPYFQFDVLDDAPGWAPLADLLDGPRWSERVEAVRAALGPTASARVAASVTHLGLVARLVSVWLGHVALHGRGVGFAGARFQPAVGGPVPLALDPADPVLDPPLLIEPAAASGVPRTVLWGNVASAVNGAVTLLDPARRDAARDEASRLAGHIPHTGALGADFRRRSCCLIYQIAPAAREYCGDCILVR